MQVFKSLVLFCFISCLASCGEPINTDKDTNLGVKTIKEELAPYPLTESMEVNGVDVEFFNEGKDQYCRYIVTLEQGEDSWSDTTTFFIRENEPSRLQVIFGESIVTDSVNAKFNSELILIQDSTDV